MGHQNTLFYEILQMIPRHEFQKAVNSYDGDKGTRRLNCWQQFSTLLFGQLTGHNALRSMTIALNSQIKYLYHLGLNTVKRSTLSDANEKRNPKILEKVFYSLLNRTQIFAPRHKYQFKGKILAMDSTTIDLCLSLCPWAESQRSNKGAMKMHTAIDLNGKLPTFMVISSGRVNDIEVAKKRSFMPGSILLFDKGYYGFEWWNKLNEQGVFFVTRIKKDCNYKVRKCLKKDNFTGIKADQEIRLTGRRTKYKYTKLLRRVSYRDPESGKNYEFITNRFDLSAQTICDLYKSRWEVELFFKTLKGYLQIDKFVGTSINAVSWQVWTAMIAYLLVSLIRFLNKVRWSVPSTMAALAVSLFQKTDLQSLLRQMPRGKLANKGIERQLLLQF